MQAKVDKTLNQAKLFMEKGVILRDEVEKRLVGPEKAIGDLETKIDRLDD